MLKIIVLCMVIACVRSNSDAASNRIVGGVDAKTGEIPYIVSVRKFGSHHCGGSILDETHVLTAAHCTEAIGANSISIQYGSTNIQNSKNVITVKKIHQHENYKPIDTRPNDVSVLTLQSPIPLGPQAQKIVLPKQSEVPPHGKSAVLAGWGHLQTGGSSQADLKRVDISVQSDAECTKIHGKNYFSTYHLCAGGAGKGQCSADSGGPLYSDGKQIGIVSWSIKPCGSNPGVFARVATYVTWIKSKMQL